MRSRLLSQVSFTATLVLAFAACDAPAPANLPSNPATETYAASLNVDLSKMTKLAGALYIQDNVVGTGATVVSGDIVGVTYTGYFVNGQIFDTNVGSPVSSFPIGQGQVIPGWDEGLLGMKVGGKRKLVIGSALGYGANGSGDIPPNTTLVFDVQLISTH